MSCASPRALEAQAPSRHGTSGDGRPHARVDATWMSAAGRRPESRPPWPAWTHGSQAGPAAPLCAGPVAPWPMPPTRPCTHELGGAADGLGERRPHARVRPRRHAALAPADRLEARPGPCPPAPPGRATRPGPCAPPRARAVRPTPAPRQETPPRARRAARHQPRDRLRTVNRPRAVGRIRHRPGAPGRPRVTVPAPAAPRGRFPDRTVLSLVTGLPARTATVVSRSCTCRFLPADSSVPGLYRQRPMSRFCR